MEVITAERDELVKRNATLETANISLKKRVARREEELEEGLKTKMEMEEKYREYGQELEELRNFVSCIVPERDELKQQLVNAQGAMQKLVKQVSPLQKENADLLVKLKEAEVFCACVVAERDALSGLAVNKDLKRDLQVAHAFIRDVSAEKDELASRNAALEEAKNAAQLRIALLERKLDELQQRQFLGSLGLCAANVQAQQRADDAQRKRRETGHEDSGALKSSDDAACARTASGCSQTTASEVISARSTDSGSESDANASAEGEAHDHFGAWWWDAPMMDVKAAGERKGRPGCSRRMLCVSPDVSA
eukprot:1965735-Rhodomonas_salina.1